MMINKNRFRVSNDKKVLHKIGKRWVTVSALTLALLGGAAAASTVTTHAANVQSVPTAQVAKKPAQSATPKNIMSAASNMHQGMLATAPKSVAPSSSASTKPSSASQSASSNASSASAKSVAPSASNQASGSSSASSVNSSSASRVNNQASGNQTVSTSSASAKSSVSSSSNNVSSEMAYLNSLSNVEYSAEVASLKGSSANATNQKQVINKLTTKQNTPKHPVNTTYQYSDIYHSVDGMTAPTANTGTTAPTTAPNNWQFVDENEKVSKNAVMKNGKVLVAPSYRGLTYKFDKANNAVEFVSGKLNWNGGNWKNFLSSDSTLENVKSIKFDDVDTTNLTNSLVMFANMPNLQSLDLGNYFDTGNVNDMEWMFSSNKKLKSLKLPNVFDARKATSIRGMFNGESDLTDLNASSLETSSDLKNMNQTFSANKALKSIELPNSLNTNQVSDMSQLFAVDTSLLSLNLPSNFNTSNVNNMYMMFYGTGLLKSLNLGNYFNTNKVRNMNYMFTGNNSLKTLNLGPNFNTSNVSNMASMFSDLHSISTINLGSKFNTKSATNMEHMFDSDYSLQSLNLGNTFYTNNVSDMYMMFIRDAIDNPRGANINLGSNFDTTKALPNNSAHTDQGIHNGTSDMFQYANLHSITMPSTAKFNAKSQLGSSWYPVEKGTDYTVPNAKITNLMDNNSHAGTWVKNPNVQQVSDTVAFYNKANDTLVGRPFTAKGADGSTYIVKEAPQGWHFVNNDNSFTLEPNMTSNVKIMVDGKPMSNQPSHDIPVAPTIVNGVITYKYNNKQAGNSINTKGRIGTSAKATVDGNVPSGYQLAGNSDSFNFWSDGGKTNAININLKALPASATVDYQYNNSTKGSHKFTGNDSRATLASDTSTNVTASNEPGMPAGYQLSNGTNNVPFDNKPHDVAIKPIQQTDNIKFMNNGHQVGTTTTKGNDSRTGINGNSTATLPTGYQLAKGASASVANDGKTHQINVTPIQKTDTIDYQLNGVTKGSHQFTGNDVQANGATGTSFNVDSSNDAGMPQGYQLVDKDNRFNYDGGTHNVAIEATNQTANVNYNLPDGTNISSGTISGNVNTSTKPTQAPQGYHFAGNVAPYRFTPANAGNNPSDNVTVAPNTVKGTATIHINYNVSGHTYNGSDQHVSINGQYGQPDKVVYPVSYQPTNDDYSTNSQPLDINFNDVAKNGSNDSYNPSTTFTYDATEAPNLVIRYDDTTNHNNVVHSDTFAPAQLGVKPQDWVVGNTFTFGTKGTKDAIDVIAAPYGYHLVNNAKGFDYQNGTETITLEPTQINTSTGTKRVILMAMPMFFHHSQPNKPVTPSSASAKPSSAASSVAPSSASTSVVPSSASQSTSSSAPARQIIDHGSIEPKSNTPEPVNTPTSTPSNKPSDVTPAHQPSDVVPVVHKHTTKPSVQKNIQPSDQIVNKNAGNTKAESKPLVEPSHYAAKVQHEAQNHMTNPSNKMAQPTVHVANVHASRISNAKRSVNVQHKLPQTNEAKAAGLMGASAIMAALGLAGADTDRKRRHE